MEASRDIKRLLDIMAALRDPETGCPWDIQQDFTSIKPYTIEEAYEVADAIEREDHEDLCEELGDLLLQVVFHSQMAREADLFTFDDVIQNITRKLIRRHPHVFNVDPNTTTNRKTDEDVKAFWENIKIQEKKERLEKRRILKSEHEENKSANGDLPQGLLQEVSRTMPANEEAIKIQQKASKVGFDWNSPERVLLKIEEEINELRTEISKGQIMRISEELGDLMFALVNLGRHLGINPEMALRDTNHKFRKRFFYMEQALKKQSKNIETVSLDEMEQLWQKAKKQIG